MSAPTSYAAIAARATVDSAFRDGLEAAAAVARANSVTVSCPGDMVAVYLDRLADGQEL